MYEIDLVKFRTAADRFRESQRALVRNNKLKLLRAKLQQIPPRLLLLKAIPAVHSQPLGVAMNLSTFSKLRRRLAKIEEDPVVLGQEAGRVQAAPVPEDRLLESLTSTSCATIHSFSNSVKSFISSPKCLNPFSSKSPMETPKLLRSSIHTQNSSWSF